MINTFLYKIPKKLSEFKIPSITSLNSNTSLFFIKEYLITFFKAFKKHYILNAYFGFKEDSHSPHNIETITVHIKEDSCKNKYSFKKYFSVTIRIKNKHLIGTGKNEFYTCKHKFFNKKTKLISFYKRRQLISIQIRHKFCMQHV